MKFNNSQQDWRAPHLASPSFGLFRSAEPALPRDGTSTLERHTMPTMESLPIIGAVIIFAFLCVNEVKAADASHSFNEYVVKAVSMISQHRRLGGYSLHEALTQDLKYGDQCCVDAIPHPKSPWPTDWVPPSEWPKGTDHKTNCVAAVHEIIIEALDLYVQETSDSSILTKRPLRFWNSSTKLSLKPYLYMYDGVNSHGTASALKKFGLGEEVQFSEMKPGGFVNLNRSSRTGHAVVFMGFIDKNGNDLPTFNAAKVAGFKYFSAQVPFGGPILETTALRIMIRQSRETAK
jgi:hypothetical protein